MKFLWVMNFKKDFNQIMQSDVSDVSLVFPNQTPTDSLRALKLSSMSSFKRITSCIVTSPPTTMTWVALGIQDRRINSFT